MKKETMTFVMHPQLLWDVITKQAGSLGKALLEGVMNSIDAGATRIDLRLTPGGFELVDDGRGFGSREEVEKFFATFGTPHTEGDARFGRFRMGRGQIFSFAKTVWTSNRSSMEVDIKTKGLDFTYRTLAESVAGCRIKGKFYDSLNARALIEAREEVIRNCLFLEIPLVINGDVVTKDPRKAKWPHSTEEAYFNLKSGGAAGINVYQQGVFVETIPSSAFGLSGVIVTRPGFPLKVNFARNQVIRDCPLFRKILKSVGVESKKRVFKRTELDDSEREMIIADTVSSGRFDHKLRTARIFKDVTGRHWSIKQLGIHFRGGKMNSLQNGKLAYTFAKSGDLTGDRLMQSGRAFVFDEDCFFLLGGDETLGFGDAKWFESVDYYMGMSSDRVEFATMADLSKDMQTRQLLVEERDLTQRERIIFAAIRDIHAWTIARRVEEALGVPRDYNNGRTLRLGISDTADGWTDGETYIAIDREFLEGIVPSVEGFSRLGNLLLHEYCHREASTSTHVHSPEFYRAFHDASDRAVSCFVAMALDRYRAELRRAGMKLNRRELKEEIMDVEQNELAAAVLGPKEVVVIPQAPAQP